jgi:hypothetical protein
MRQRFETLTRKDRPLPHLPGCTDLDAMKTNMVSSEIRYCLSTLVLAPVGAGGHGLAQLPIGGRTSIA